MKKLLFSIVFIISGLVAFGQIVNSDSQGQNSEQSSPPKNFFLGFQYSTGIFSPGDVNDYIENYLDAHNMLMQSGFSSIIMNQCLSVTGLYMLNNNFGVQGGADVAFAPKYIAVLNGDSKMFSFWRISPWAAANLYAGSFCISGKGMFNMMGFEGYNVTAPGLNLTASYGVNISILRLSPFIAFDYAKGSKHNFELNYTDVRFGMELLIGVR